MKSEKLISYNDPLVVSLVESFLYSLLLLSSDYLGLCLVRPAATTAHHANLSLDSLVELENTTVATNATSAQSTPTMQSIPSTPSSIPSQSRKTLVLDLDETLVHCKWSCFSCFHVPTGPIIQNSVH